MLQGRIFQLDEEDLALLQHACTWHTDERTHPDPTIRTCYDADRLDLGRVGIIPDPRYLGTEAAKELPLISWADGRARFRVVPAFVRDEWGITVEPRGQGRGAGV